MGKINNFADMRNKMNLTQAKVAEKLNVAKNTLSQWENGKREPDFKTLKILAKLYQCSIDELLAHEEVIEIKQPEQVELDIEDNFTDKQKELLNIIKDMDNDDINKIIGYAYSLNEQKLSTEEKIQKLLKEYKNLN